MPKVRLDTLLVERQLVSTQSKAQAFIMSGIVSVDGQIVSKAGTLVVPTVGVEIKQDCPYVSRGGLKLESAHSALQFPIVGRVAMDIGISTGGFSDFLLQHGARHIIGVDVSYGFLAHSLRHDLRVTLLEKTNARYLTENQMIQMLEKNGQNVSLVSQIDLIVMDVSFISLTKVLPAIRSIVSGASDWIVLLKPQFEATRAEVSKGNGVIRDPVVHEAIVKRVCEQVPMLGFEVYRQCASSVLGPKGNQEIFLWLKPRSNS